MKTNPHLRKPGALKRIVAQSAYESSVFEGASPQALDGLRKRGYSAPRAQASAKKPTSKP